MRMTIEEAAKRLGLPKQTLRLWIQSGKCSFGDVIIEGKKKNTYYISSERFEAYLKGENKKNE